VDRASNSPHDGHFFVTVVEYTAPQLVHALNDCLLIASLLDDIRQSYAEETNEAILNTFYTCCAAHITPNKL